MAEDRREVVVTDIKIPFWSMVILMVKWAIAAIPAMFILLVMSALVSIALAAIFGGGEHHWDLYRWWGSRA